MCVPIHNNIRNNTQKFYSIRLAPFPIKKIYVREPKKTKQNNNNNINEQQQQQYLFLLFDSVCSIILYCIIIIAQFSLSISPFRRIRAKHTHTQCNIAKSIVLPSIKILTWKSDKSLIAENKRMYVWCVGCCVYVWFYFNFVVKRLLMKVNGFVWMGSHKARAFSPSLSAQVCLCF